MRRATGRTLHVPTMAERLRWHCEVSVSCANVSPGAAYFQDPDGHGFVYHSAGSYGPGHRPIDDPASAVLKKGLGGDQAMTDRFCGEILEERAPALAIMWLSEPDYTGHHSPLGSPEHRAAIAGADRCVRQPFISPSRRASCHREWRAFLLPRTGLARCFLVTASPRLGYRPTQQCASR
jgi:hypothetical protein